MFSAVVFDMDGVLIDSHPLHFRNWNQILSEAGRPASDKDLEVLLEGAKRTEIIRRFFGELTEQEIEHFCQRKEQLFREGEDSLRTVAGVDAFLDTIEKAQIPKAVVTSASRPRSERLLKRFDLRERFAAVIAGDSVHNGKEDPEIFHLALEHLGVCAAECLLIEDSPAAIRSARMLGMPSVGMAPPSRVSQLFSAGAFLVVPDFTSLQFDQLCEKLKKHEMSEKSN